MVDARVSRNCMAGGTISDAVDCGCHVFSKFDKPCIPYAIVAFVTAISSS